MKDLVSRLIRHTRWANERTLSSLCTLPSPPEDAVHLFAHIVTTEKIYLNRIRSEDPFPQEFWPILSLDEAEILMEENAEALQTFIAERSEGELRKPVRYRNSKGTAFETPLEQMFAHLALHGEHHRGQIARLVRKAGGEPAVTDLIFFVREEDPKQRVST